MTGRLLITIAILMRTSVSQTWTCDSHRMCYDDTMSGATFYCYGYESCRIAAITATSWVYARSMYSAYQATITTASMYIDGYRAFMYGDLTASSTLYAMGEEGSYDAAITATTIYAYGWESLVYADISATTVYADAYRTLIYADLEPKDTTLTVYFRAYQSGYTTDIYCNDGQTCNVYCEQPYACYDVNIYCYTGSTCTYENNCDESGTSYCIDHYETGPGMTDVDIRKIYEENKKRMPEPEPAPVDGPDGDEPDQPDVPVKIVPNGYGHYYLSFSNAQFALLCLLNALLIFATVGFCFYHTSDAAKKYLQKEDYN